MSDDEQPAGQTPLQRYIEATTELPTPEGNEETAGWPDSLTVGGTGKGQTQLKLYFCASRPAEAAARLQNSIALAALATSLTQGVIG